MKADFIEHNVTLKITLRGRRIKKWQKFKRKKRIISQPERCSKKASDFVALALQRSKCENVTDNRKQQKSDRSNL